MKKRNTYYYEVFGRPAILKKLFLTTFLGMSYYFRVPIEIITRRNMGERYFNILLTASIGLGLLFPPLVINVGFMGEMNWGTLFGLYGTWYIYTAIYFYTGWQRWKEVRNNPSVWDVKRFSLSSGYPHPFFYKLVGERYRNPRFISTIVEPGVFFVIGLVLTILLQPLGIMLMSCAVVYSLGYAAAYYMADQFVMDKIDEMICNEDLYNIFVNEIPSERGFEFHAKRPKDRDTREKLYDDYIDVDYEVDDEPQEVK